MAGGVFGGDKMARKTTNAARELPRSTGRKHVQGHARPCFRKTRTVRAQRTSCHRDRAVDEISTLPTQGSEFMTDNHVHRTNEPSKRRALLVGAAWGVPVIAYAATAPFASASCLSSGSRTFIPVGTGSVNNAALETSFVVPQGVRTLSFIVEGGGGGGFRGPNVVVGATEGGSSTSMRGTLRVSPGQTLNLIVGQGGIGPSNVSTATYTGGRGYGNGGSSAATPGASIALPAGSGGGGSAILSGATALVVSGGGGGGASTHTHLVPSSAPNPTSSGGTGGNGASKGATQRITFSSGDSDSADGGFGGSTVGGSGGAATLSASATPTPTFRQALPGLTGTGRDGSNGVSLLLPAAGTFPAVSIASAAGGGGYFGGGSGGVTGTRWNERSGLTIGGAGGGASNYAAATVTVSSSNLANNGGNLSDVRRPGRIVLTWTC